MYLRSDGFDTYGVSEADMLLAQWSEVSAFLSASNPRNGTHSLQFASNDFARIAFGAAYKTSIVSFAIDIEAQASFDLINWWSFRNAANGAQVTLGLTTTGAIRAYRGERDGTALGTSADLVVGAGAWYFIENKVTVDAVSGAVEVRVNGVTVLNLTGINTLNAGSDEASQVRWGQNTNGDANAMWIDDLHILNTSGTYLNDFIGDHAVIEDVPDADGADTGWTPSAGLDSYAMVDEIPQDGDTTYVQASAVNDRVSYTFPDLPAGYTGVACVELFHISRKTTAGDGTVKTICHSNVTEADGDSDALTETYSGYGSAFEIDPDTSLPWTIAGANAVEMVEERTL